MSASTFTKILSSMRRYSSLLFIRLYIAIIKILFITGSRICHHGKYRHVCKQCGGSGICEHNKVKYSCAQCKGTSTKKKGVTSANSSSVQPPNFEFPKESTEAEVLYTTNSSKDNGASVLDNEKDVNMLKPMSDVSTTTPAPITPFMTTPYVPMCYDTGMNMNPFNPMHLNMLMMMQGQNPFALNPAAGFPFNMNSFAFNPNTFAYNPANGQMMLNPQAMMAAQLMNSMNVGMQQTSSSVSSPSADDNNTKK